MRIGKLIAAVTGVLLVITGIGLGVAGGIALAVPDDDGWVSVGPVRVDSSAAAIVGDDIDIDLGETVADGNTFISWAAIPTRIAVDGDGVFVGIGPVAEVEQYLDGVAVAHADWDHRDIDIDGYVPGGSAGDPTAQTFWVASTTDGVLEWDLAGGDWAVVVMNADGSPGIDVALDAAARVPWLPAIGVGVLILGGAFLAGGIALTYAGVRATPQPTISAPPQPATGG